MPERKILNGWKEIASHLGRSTRTVQRWEFTHGMPVHRPTASKRSAVSAFSDELESWMSRTTLPDGGYIRPIIVVLDRPDPDRLTNRKLALEIEKFNVLTAYSLEELFATAERTTYDAIVMNCDAGGNPPTLCGLIKEQFPDKPLFVVAPNGDAPDNADHLVRTRDDRDLVNEIVSVFGKPKAA
jgi:hypothetical protein